MSQSLADFSDLYFQVSWWMLALISVVGAGVFFYGSRRLEKKLQRVGVVLVMLGILLATLRYVFPPARELMEARTRALVNAVNRQQCDALSMLLSPQTSIGDTSRAYMSGPTRINDFCKAEVNQIGLESVYALGVDSQRTQTLITVSMEVVSTQSATADRPVTSTWQFDYEKSGDQWMLDKITLIRIGEENGEVNFNPFHQ